MVQCAHLASGLAGQRRLGSFHLHLFSALPAAPSAPALAGPSAPICAHLLHLCPQHSDVVAASLDILAELTARYGSLLPDPEGLKKVGGRVKDRGGGCGKAGGVRQME